MHNKLKTSVLLVQPPYFRLLGSHNDRVPLELCYLHYHLNNFGIKSAVLNADWTGASVYITWRKLFENFEYLKNAVDGQSPFFDETIERILSFNPEVVILSAADNITPWVDLGNAYFTANLAKKLRNYKIYTTGVGPYYNKVPDKFIQYFDSILVGIASPSILDIINNKPRNKIVRGASMDIESYPLMERVYPGVGADVIMTGIGCPYSCTFCYGAETGYRPVPDEIVLRDLANRKSEIIDIGDAIFPIRIKNNRNLVEKLASTGKKFTCEINVKSVTEKILTDFKKMGIVALKLGVESGDEFNLNNMKKNHTISEIYKAVQLIKKFNFILVIYILLGGPYYTRNMAIKTYQLCKNLCPDDFVINVFSFHDIENRDFRYDSHFSKFLAEQWYLNDIIYDFFNIQSSNKLGLGHLI